MRMPRAPSYTHRETERGDENTPIEVRSKNVNGDSDWSAMAVSRETPAAPAGTGGASRLAVPSESERGGSHSDDGHCLISRCPGVAVTAANWLSGFLTSVRWHR